MIDNDKNSLLTGMDIYDYIVNNVGVVEAELPQLIAQLNAVDTTGQFLASSARFLSSVGKEAFAVHISRLVECAIDKDRERKYIGSLLEALWGKNYMENAQALRGSDDNFRRIFKRIFPDKK